MNDDEVFLKRDEVFLKRVQEHGSSAGPSMEVVPFLAHRSCASIRCTRSMRKKRVLYKFSRVKFSLRKLWRRNVKICGVETYKLSSVKAVASKSNLKF